MKEIYSVEFIGDMKPQLFAVQNYDELSQKIALTGKRVMQIMIVPMHYIDEKIDDGARAAIAKREAMEC